MSTDGQDTADGDMLMSPNKRPRTLSKACETCKQKKTRCDSSRPHCGTCRRTGTACVYREKGQPGLRPGYGKAIEQRLSLLESNMDKINQSIQDVLNHVRPDIAASSTVLEAPARDAGPSGRNGPEAQMWQSSQLPEMPYFPASPLIERLPAPLSLPPLDLTERGLPPVQVVQELVELFFEVVYPYIPLFCKQNFTANMFTPERQILLHGIVAVSFRFWRKQAPSPEERDRFVKTSREQVLLKAIDTCTLVSTQALALLALDAIGQGPGPRTLNLTAMLVTAAHQLGLGKSHSPTTPETNTPLVRNEDPDDGMDSSNVAVEEKRRLFWAIYSLDRFSSVSHGQSGGIDTKTIKLPYPSSDVDWGQTMTPEWFQAGVQAKPAHTHCPASLWHHNIDLLALLDRSNQLLIQPVNLSLPAHCQEWQSIFRRLDITMSTWFENLPKEVRERPASFDPMWFMLHATFHLINIRMYTVAAFPSTTSPYLRPSASARGRCRQAIRTVASLASSLQTPELDRLHPMFAFVVWVATRSLIILWTTGYENAYGSTPTDLEPLLNVLRHMATRWLCAQRYADIIQLILDTKNNPGGPTGLEIFNDTRRTSYGLQNLLGTLVVHRVPEAFPNSFDFLDISLLDVGELSVPRLGGVFGAENDGEWL
ncbi:uncharacterized protein Z519_05209 [Cladophialophora bantiana CBS 173.52]|uniref:Zn(2)-C6 fungal-type domain-containing protein n=1 Tax=Cladophialophora bantiana (strain ATCC 10958 / CBS 173.52 / CDC B-1940 / NIH 8579) TaxID=1442370 RepID=A0A0D2IAS6_CLAB1|nr:uncharacterized protein Z519_05209 [Cladophialophora bantiana CBS 173.52]KIW93894.1 hypothetical protein Z519_05209 [Cladophialophora bantiana CBS 173.52]